MNTPDPTRHHPVETDQDMVDQAQPGHGIPSQDPDPAAQVALDPAEAERESRSVMTGGGMVGGAALGATLGIAVAGPVGVVVGGTLGAVAGALGGAAAGGLPGSQDGDGTGKSAQQSHSARPPSAPADRR